MMASSIARAQPSEDFFDDALNVESNFHSAGYNQGLVDGAQAGLAEGRGFGMQKGFEKFFEAGRLASRSIVWANRLPIHSTTSEILPGRTPTNNTSLPSVPNNLRLEKNIVALYGLTDPNTLSTNNSDAAVQDFDDRMKRAEGKVRIIQRVVDGVVLRDDLKES